MKKMAWRLIAVMFLVVFLTTIGGAQEIRPPEPAVAVANPMIKIIKDTKAVIMGSGFKAGQEIRILFMPLDGVITDIGFALKPYPVPNKHGNWVTTWSCDDQLKLDIAEGPYSIVVSTMDFVPLAQTPVAFYKEKEEKKPTKP